MSQCHFSNIATDICIEKKKIKQKISISIKKYRSSCAKPKNRRNSRSSLLSKGGSRWFEVLRVSGLRGGHEAYGKEMRLTPRDLQRGLKLTVLYWARWTCRSVLGCLNICKHFSSITIKRNFRRKRNVIGQTQW